MAQIILGIETSCDETAAAVYSVEQGMLSNVLFSSIDEQKFYGGVVPELASRTHLQKINEIIDLALTKANKTIDDIDTIAVTNRPGLPGSLLVGVCTAKAIAWAKQKKIIGINHLEGHAFSACIENTIPFPFLCITASGGHTSLYIIEYYGNYRVLGQTVDDAAGEAFDKIAKMMNVPYPGGPQIETWASQAGFKDFFKYPRANNKVINFSFSGLKTAVLYDLVKRNAYDLPTKQFLQDDNLELKQQVASSLLVCVKDIFIQKLTLALSQHPEAQAITFVGGVACNKYLKQQLSQFAQKKSLPFFAPTPQYCTDNAGMIAYVGSYKAARGEFDDYDLDIL